MKNKSLLFKIAKVVFDHHSNTNQSMGFSAKLTIQIKI